VYDEAGAAAVEFALVTPILLVFLLGIFEFGRAWNAYHVVAEAARNGARLASVAESVSSDSVKSSVKNVLSAASLDPAKATITVEGNTGATGTPAKVTVDYQYNFLFWHDESQSNPRTSLRLRTASVMRRE
jgi:Flp pilus assembly protein TadG